MTPCFKSITAEIPHTKIPVELMCKLAKGHTGTHIAVGTFNSVEFEVEWATPNEV